MNGLLSIVHSLPVLLKIMHHCEHTHPAEPPAPHPHPKNIFSPPECNAAIHKKCIDKIIGRCTGTATNSRDTMVWIVLHCSRFFSFFVPWFFKVILFFCAYSFRRSVLRLTCHIALRTTTTWAPPFVTIVAVCCGVLSNRASNARVSIRCMYWKGPKLFVSHYLFTLCFKAF